ncbi:MAG: AhpC/TSA family protein [Porphyromonadaceae bacterium]|nr:AhpC/TSA family protein [Porphyromonadaceae bacterium]
MRKLLFLFLSAGFLLSCQNVRNYTIKGTVTDTSYEGTKVYVQQMTDEAMVVVDSVLVTDGSFSLKGVADSTVLRFISLDETVNPQQESRVPVLIEPGRIEVLFDTVVTVKGTKTNDAYTDFRTEQRALTKTIRRVTEQYNTANAEGTMTDSLETEINTTYDSISIQLTDLNFNFIKENIGNELGKYVFLTSSSMFAPEQQREILNLADEKFKASKNIQRITQRLENLENVAVGKKFVDFTLKDTEGNEVSLSDYAGKGKYVLVDFWAVWCGPCRREMPNVVAAYKKYKSRGFEVVGVSLDKDHEKWIQGLKDLNMTWSQMSDLQYWESPVVDLYAIDGIPHTVLLDKDGIIIAKDLRGDALDAKLAELMP